MATELDALIKAFKAAPARAEREVGKAVTKTAEDLVRTAKKLINGQITRTYLPHYARSIGYDKIGRLEADVGPNGSMPQGGMGRAIEYGSAKHGPLPHMIPASHDIEPRFDKRVSDALAKVLE